jgi:hypothetical protein
VYSYLLAIRATHSAHLIPQQYCGTVQLQRYARVLVSRYPPCNVHLLRVNDGHELSDCRMLRVSAVIIRRKILWTAVRCIKGRTWAEGLPSKGGPAKLLYSKSE